MERGTGTGTQTIQRSSTVISTQDKVRALYTKTVYICGGDLVLNGRTMAVMNCSITSVKNRLYSDIVILHTSLFVCLI